jgi:predicted signal transduction protein with EAL and GGDEF domain
MTDGVDMTLTLVQRAHLVDAPEPDRCTGGPVTTVVLDADDFQDLADRLGGDAGTRILGELADRLQARLCRCGVTTHLAHDALGIVCIGLAGDDGVDAALVEMLSTPFELGDDLLEVRAS